MAEVSSQNGLKMEYLNTLQDNFQANESLQLAQMVATRANFSEVFRGMHLHHQNNHLYNVQVKEVKPVSHQKSSGRCWIFSLLNCMRIPFAEKYKIDEFEFSHNYLFYWDKLERSYFELHNYLRMARSGATSSSQLAKFLLTDPVADGGQWDMLVNLVCKYGVMPKSCWLESVTAENTSRMNSILRTKMRHFCKLIYDLVAAQKTDEEVKEAIDKEMFPLIHQLITVCLGSPPKQFLFHYKNSSKEVCQVGPLSPQQFYEEHVKPVFDVETKICLIHDPRATSVYFDTYTVDYLNNMVGGKPVHYLNVPLDKIKSVVMASLKSGEPVWFGSDIGRAHDRQLGLATLTLLNHKLVFGFDHHSSMTKAERLEFHDSFMTHAMVIVGAQEETENSVPNDESPSDEVSSSRVRRWRVENSWGSEYGSSGYLSMWDDWFDEFVYQVVIDRKYATQEMLEAWTKTPHIFPAWDPFGTLAF